MTSSAIEYKETRDLPVESVVALYRANDLVVRGEARTLAPGAAGLSFAGHGLGWPNAGWTWAMPYRMDVWSFTTPTCWCCRHIRGAALGSA